MNAKPPHIFISAGEASGDMHGSNLLKALQQRNPAISCTAMGGILLNEAGAKIIVDSTDLAVIGGIEILRHLHKIVSAMHKVKRELTINKPDLLILIDYPGFNLWLAKIAKKMGIKVLYYISPQIWAWHQSRIKKIKRYIDMMAVVFPFEVKFYTNAGVPAVLVRHPLLDTVSAPSELSNTKQQLALDPQAITIGLFPGSRESEIQRLLPVMLQSAVLLKNDAVTKNRGEIQFVIPLASSLKEDMLKPYLAEFSSSLNIHIIKKQTYATASICDAIIATSGTVTLEIALLHIPMVIIYRLTNLTYWIAKKIIKIPYVGLCNIVAEKKIVPELIQHQACAKNISKEIQAILDDKDYRETMIAKLKNVRQKLEIGDEKNKTQDIVDVVLCQIP